jgi:formamidopyrimidine-DNA glycosylase
MPELPEVETVRRGLAPVMEGRRIKSVTLSRPNLRFSFPDQFSKRLQGARIEHMGRRAKYLVARLDTGEALIMHLGMSGSFRVELDPTSQTSASGDMNSVFYHPKSERKAHDHVIFDMGDGEATVIYNDPRRFGYMDLVAIDELETCTHFLKMGIEPTGNQLNGEAISRLFAGKSSPLKSALLDQRLIAGLGNIYVCEALWRTGLSPKRKASTISRKDGKATQRSEALSRHIREIIAEAIEAGGSSLRDHRQANGDLGYFQHRFNAYDREGEYCAKPDCSGKIGRIVQSGRSTFFCPSCQR